MKVTFNRLAAEELIAAARHINAEANLGHAFLEEYETWEKQVKQFPQSSPEIAPGIRCGYLKRFKYHVTYRVEADAIRVLYLRHEKQSRLKNWNRR